MNKQNMTEAKDYAMKYVESFKDSTYGSVVVNWDIKRTGKADVPALTKYLESRFGFHSVPSQRSRVNYLTGATETVTVNVNPVIDALISDGLLKESPRHPRGGFSVFPASFVRPVKASRRREVSAEEATRINALHRTLTRI